MLAETKKAGVVLHLEPSEQSRYDDMKYWESVLGTAGPTRMREEGTSAAAECEVGKEQGEGKRRFVD